MSDIGKVKPSHTQRAAFVYIRQSSPAQVEYNRESTARQYALVEKACQLGWAKEQVIVIDEDLGLTGSGWAKRSGFAHMTAEVLQYLTRTDKILGRLIKRVGPCTLKLRSRIHEMLVQKKTRDDIAKMLQTEFHWVQLHLDRGLDGAMAELQ